MDDPRSVSVEFAGTSERPVVERLLQLYLYDFSGFATAADGYGLIGADGLFGYADFSTYWTGDGKRRAFLFRLNQALAGFALANEWPPSGRPVDQALAEFFILQKYRRAGIGQSAAAALFRTLPGVWELGVAAYNAPALSFWRAALRAGAVVDLEESAGDGERWAGTIFRFRS